MNKPPHTRNAMKIYGWTGFRAQEIDDEFPETDRWRRQTREIVAARSKAEVGRIVGDRPTLLQNLAETGNEAEIVTALAEPGVVFWKPLDDKSGRWARQAAKATQDDDMTSRQRPERLRAR